MKSTERAIGNESHTESSNDDANPENDVCQGPSLELSHQQLLFHSAPSALATAVLNVKNKGTTALYYKWTQEHPEYPTPAFGRGKEDRFFMYDRKGAILPGHSKDFRCSPIPHPRQFMWRGS